jgi:hypothetical protein
MNPIDHLVSTWQGNFEKCDVKLTKREFKDFLVSKYITCGKLQEKTIGKIFCEVYSVDDPVLNMFVSDEYCIDRIKSFYVK